MQVGPIASYLSDSRPVVVNFQGGVQSSQVAAFPAVRKFTCTKPDLGSSVMSAK